MKGGDFFGSDDEEEEQNNHIPIYERDTGLKASNTHTIAHPSLTILI